MCQFFNSVTNQTSLSPNDEPEINVLDLPYYAILTLHSAMANVEISLIEGRKCEKSPSLRDFFIGHIRLIGTKSFTALSDFLTKKVTLLSEIQ